MAPVTAAPTRTTRAPAKAVTPLAVKPSTTIVQVTPEVAKHWLESNTRNRSIRPRVVNAYARDMAAGNWQLTGEAVKFDAHGNLLDGQHRLYAVTQSGASVLMLVIRGVDPAAQEVMDSGARRKPSDALAIEGYTNVTVLASAARMAMAMGDGVLTGEHASKTYTHSEVRDYVHDNPDLAHAADVAAGYRKGLGDIPPSVMAVAWWSLARVDPHAAGAFFDAMANNATSGAGDPRSALLHRIGNARRHGETLSQATYLSLIFRAWNAWRRGQHITKLPTQTRGSFVSIPLPK